MQFPMGPACIFLRKGIAEKQRVRWRTRQEDAGQCKGSQGVGGKVHDGCEGMEGTGGGHVTEKVEFGELSGPVKWVRVKSEVTSKRGRGRRPTNKWGTGMSLSITTCFCGHPE